MAPLAAVTPVNAPMVGPDRDASVVQPSSTFAPGPEFMAYTQTGTSPAPTAETVTSNPWAEPAPG